MIWARGGEERVISSARQKFWPLCAATIYILFAGLLRRLPFPLRALANEILGYELFLLRT